MSVRSPGSIRRLTAAQTEWLRNLWYHRGDRGEWQALALDVRPELTTAEWDRAGRFCNCNQVRLRDARREFLMALNGNF